MSKVALRVYNREIETLVDQGHIEESIAHCQHILKIYPKHLETYRLLGKAYLEAHRHADAADIFQRVLVSVPDDFVSQLGMSLVRDEQKDLDGAIWHMERAFEVNPSNGAVQGELRRLYGRRDGLEPPKIRLTRGALAHMYTKGGQYQQAIVEIKSVLTEDGTRLDMKILMARAFYRAGQKVEATEICIDLLKDFPFCLDANRILVEVLPGTSMSQSLDTYKKRVQALDPYAAQVTGSIFDIDSVPDTALTLERLEWDPESFSSQDSFASSSSGQSGEQLPDFLRTSGWGPSTGEFQEGQVDFSTDEPPAASNGIAAAEIPDWLKAMAPPGSSASTAEQNTPAADQDLGAEDLDWLSGLGGPISGTQTPEPSSQPQAAKPDSSGDQPDWLRDLGGSAEMSQPHAESQPQAAQPDSSADQPDWMKDLGAVTAAPAAGVAAEEGLDWLQTLNASPEPETPTAQADEPAAEGLDWLQTLNTSPQAETPIAQPDQAPAEDIDWLQSLGGPQDGTPSMPAEPVPQPTESPADDMDWLKNLGEPQDAGLTMPAASQSSEAQPASAADDIDWLKSLGGPQDAAASVPTTGPIDATPAVEIPSQSKPEAKVPKGFSGDDDDIPPLTAPISGPGTSESEQDDAMKWLESLAQKQGAKAEELITNPGERTDTVPAWAAQASAEPAAPPVETPPVVSQPPVAEKRVMAQDDPNFVPGPLSELVSGPGTSASEQDDAMKWLESLAEKQGAKAEELITNPGERTDAAPTWATQTTQEPAPPVETRPSTSQLVSGFGTIEPEQDDAMKWLEGLTEKQDAQPEASIANPVAGIETASDWLDRTAPAVDQPPGVSAAMDQPTIPQKRVMAQDDPNFVPGPLSELVSGPGTSVSEQDDAMKWLESLAEKQGAKPEELITNPVERTDAAPTWATQTEQQPVTPVETPPVASQPTIVQKPAMAQDDPNFVPGPLSELVSGPGTSASEQDDAMKWLESLAEKQGAKAEELITNPGERTDAAPTWTTQANEQPTVSTPPVETPPVASQPPIVQTPAMAQDDPNFVPGPLSELVSGPGTSASEQDDAMKWLESLAEKQGAKPEELITNPVERTDQAPTWAAQASAAPAEAETPSAPAAQDDDTMAWLQGLAANEPESQAPADLPSDQPASEPEVARMPWEQEETAAQPTEELPWETQAPPVAEQSAPQVESQPSIDVSDWLNNLDVQDQVQPASSVPAAAPSDQMPDWLNSTQQAAASDDDLPDWLKDQSADEQPVAPAQAATWIPESQAAPVSDEFPKLIFSPPLETPPPPVEVAAPAAPVAASVPASTPIPTTPISSSAQPLIPVRPAVRQTGMLGDKDGPALQNARQLMEHGGLDAAISGYVKLIKRAKFLEEVIYDLKEATYTHPVDVVVWQTLGDAHMRANQLQEALDAYTKAEELLR